MQFHGSATRNSSINLNAKPVQTALAVVLKVVFHLDASRILRKL